MTDIAVQVRVLEDTPAGCVLELGFRGDAESRPDGIASLVESSLSEAPAAGVVFDLTDLRYCSWDDIGIHGVVAATNGFTRPCRIVSKGRNRKNLGELLGVTKLGTLLGGFVYENSDAALESIRSTLGTETP